MTIQTIHRLDKLVLPGGVEICELTNQKWDPQLKSLIERPAGHFAPMFRANQEQKPLGTFSTPQLATVLAACPVNGVGFDTPSDTYFKKGATTGSVTRATTEHRRIQVPKSLLYWSSITLEHNGVSTVDCTLLAVYDGTNEPFVYTGSVPLSGNLTANEYFGVGPWKVNGVQMPDPKRVRINSGVNLIQEGGASDLWDTYAAIETIEPVAEIEVIEEINWNTLGLQGTALDGTNGLELWARKYKDGESRVANATAEHIKFTGLLGSAIPVDSTGQGTAPITDTIRCELIAPDDTTLPLTINTAAAIA